MNKDTVILTKHCIKRMKERLGIPKKAAQSTAQKAFNLGLQHSATKGRLNRWIGGVFMEYKKANNIRIYGKHVYLFAGLTLITVYHLPHKLENAAHNLKLEGGES